MVNISDTFYMKCQRIILSIYGVVPYPLQRFSIIIYHIYAVIILCLILTLTYIRYLFADDIPVDFGITGVNKISDVFMVIYILSTSVVHFVLQLDSILKYKLYFELVETAEKITNGVVVGRKCIIYEMTHLIMLIMGIYITYIYGRLEGLRGIFMLRIVWSELCCRMKVVQYVLCVEIIDGCLSKALLRLSNLRSFRASRRMEATKEFLDIQRYLRRVNEFEDQIFNYLGASLVVSFVFETCTFVMFMYFTTLVFSEWVAMRMGKMFSRSLVTELTVTHIYFQFP